MKCCSKCNQNKPIIEFGKNKRNSDGLTVWCKTCRNEYQRQYRKDNIDKVRKSNRLSKRRERAIKGNDFFRKRERSWYQNNKEHKREYVANRRQDDKKKIWAQNKLNKAVKSGKVARPKICPICNEEKKIDGHHYDYNKPLDVIWACRSCHMKEHSPYFN